MSKELWRNHWVLMKTVMVSIVILIVVQYHWYDWFPESMEQVIEKQER